MCILFYYAPFEKVIQVQHKNSKNKKGIEGKVSLPSTLDSQSHKVLPQKQPVLSASGGFFWR